MRRDGCLRIWDQATLKEARQVGGGDKRMDRAACSPDGRLQPFMAGAGVLALKLGVPVVPVHLGGLGRLKQEARYFASPGEVTLTVGEPIVFPRDDDAAREAAELERRVAELSS